MARQGQMMMMMMMMMYVHLNFFHETVTSHNFEAEAITLLMSFLCFIALWKHTCRPIKMHILSNLFYTVSSYTGTINHTSACQHGVTTTNEIICSQKYYFNFYNCFNVQLRTYLAIGTVFIIFSMTKLKVACLWNTNETRHSADVVLTISDSEVQQSQKIPSSGGFAEKKI